MKYALISPNELVETGYRVAEVTDNQFDVAQPLFWVDCDDNIIADQYFYDTATQQILPVPVPVLEPQPITGTQTL